MSKISKWLALTALLLCSLLLTPVPAKAATMNMSSITLKIGETYQLKAVNGGTVLTASSWSSSRPKVATVSSKGKVTAKEKGSTVISAKVSGATIECLVSVVQKTTGNSVRYSVLIMDTSGSMKGTALSYAKTAAKRFASSVLSAKGRNYLAVISLNTSPKVVCGFTGNSTTVRQKISGLTAQGNTNMENAIAKAGNLLKNVPDGTNVIKNIVLLSDGIPQYGKKQATGRYTASQNKYYQYANAAYATDAKLKKKYFVYALGFFHKVSSSELPFCKRLMKDLASVGRYYIVTEPEEIDDFLNTVSEEITVEHPKMTVTFNPRGGATSQKTKTVTHAKAYGKLPYPTRKGYQFLGWYTATSGGTKIVATTKVTKKSDHTLYAHWKAKPHRYRVVNTSMTRYQAKAKARDLGGYLCCINSESEQKLIESLVKKQSTIKYHYWLGGHYNKDIRQWRWDDGTPFTYKNWDSGNSEGGNDLDVMAFVGVPRPGTGKKFGEWFDTYRNGEGSSYDGYYDVKHFGYIIEWNE